MKKVLRICFNCKIIFPSSILSKPLLTDIRGFTDNSGLRVHMYFREEDHRARIVCKVPRARRANDYYCLPLNLLEVVRVGPCLQLRRRRRGGDELWANLKFTTVERMLYHFSFGWDVADNCRNGPLFLHLSGSSVPGLWSTGRKDSRL